MILKDNTATTSFLFWVTQSILSQIYRSFKSTHTWLKQKPNQDNKFILKLYVKWWFWIRLNEIETESYGKSHVVWANQSVQFGCWCTQTRTNTCLNKITNGLDYVMFSQRSFLCCDLNFQCKSSIGLTKLHHYRLIVENGKWKMNKNRSLPHFELSLMILCVFLCRFNVRHS